MPSTAQHPVLGDFFHAPVAASTTTHRLHAPPPAGQQQDTTVPVPHALLDRLLAALVHEQALITVPCTVPAAFQPGSHAVVTMQDLVAGRDTHHMCIMTPAQRAKPGTTDTLHLDIQDGVTVHITTPRHAHRLTHYASLTITGIPGAPRTVKWQLHRWMALAAGTTVSTDTWAQLPTRSLGEAGAEAGETWRVVNTLLTDSGARLDTDTTYALHTCGRCGCIHPRHLALGSKKQGAVMKRMHVALGVATHRPSRAEAKATWVKALRGYTKKRRKYKVVN